MNALSFFLFIATLVFAPLAFGSVETWSITIVECLIFLTALTCFFHSHRQGKSILQIPGILPLSLLLLWMFLQLIPLPPDLVKLIAPAIHQTYAPLLDLNGNSYWIPLTVNQKDSLLEWIRFTSYGVFYILTVQLLGRSEMLTKTVKIIAWLSIGIAFLAIIQKFTSPHEIYWFRPTPSNSGTVGPWVYHNHYAGFMELVFPLTLALFFYYRPTFIYQQNFRSRAASIFSAPGSNLHFFLGFGGILILASVFIALSRGGIIAISLGLFFFLLLLSSKRAKSGSVLPLVLIGCLLLAVTWLGWDPILAKFNRTLTETGGINDARLHIWQDCAPMIRDFFFTGTGFGTFIHVYPQYSTIPSTSIFDHAHNDYIELLTDGGIIGFLLAAWFVLTIVIHGFQKLRCRRNHYSILVIIAGLTAIFSLLLHSVTDFNMHNGANGLYFFFLCGLLISAGNTRLQYRTRPTLLSPVSSRWKWTYFAALPLLLLTVTFQGGILIAGNLYQKLSHIYLNPQLSEQTLQKLLTTINKVTSLDPLEASYPYYKGNLLFTLKQPELAFTNYLLAANKDPLEGVYLQRLGMFLTATNIGKAAQLMATGYARSLNKEKLIFTWAEWLERMNRKDEAIIALHQGFSQFPHLAPKFFSLLLISPFSREEIEAIFPKKVDIWIQFGKFKEDLGQMEEAEYYRRHALDFIDMEDTIKPWYFLQLYSFYQKQKQTDKAIDVLRKGIEQLPDHAPFHLYLGDYYKQQNIPYRAKEEYEQARILEPANESILKRLKAF
ncbi:MAG: O-antigen ligase family protein [Desulfocapsaceae bacterium]|nr:O-antigen ligase family protein [Desulfocapsaceae bacterium]